MLYEFHYDNWGEKKKAEKDKGNKEHMGLGKNTRRQTHLNI